MEKNRAGRNRRLVIWIDMLALTGILVIAAVIWSGFLEDAAQENLATKTGQQTAEEVPENPLQIILSMGAEPGSLSISWKGDAAGPEALQLDGVTGEKQRFTAVRERILKSDYYRYHVELSGLTQGTEYRYTIGENAFSGSFRVPHESDVTRFLYLGDVQFQESMEEYEEWGQMVRRAYREHPELDFYPRTFIFGAKAAAGYRNAKLTIKLINSVADVVNNDPAINGKIKVVFIENYNVSNAEIIFAAADVSEQISTASKEASGTGNMKFMLNGALTLGTMDGANVEIVEEVGKENAFIFGLSADQVIEYENNYTYDPMSYFIHDQDIHNVVMDLISGRYSNGDTMMFRDLYDSLLTPKNAPRPDMYFTLADFKSYAAAQERVEDKYRNTSAWARSAILNTAHSGKFTSDRTIQQYVDDIWHLDKITVRK